MPIENNNTTQNFFHIPVSLPEISSRLDEELQKRYWAEKALLDLLPELEKSATSYELILAIQSHKKVTEHQIDRLLHIFGLLEERAMTSRYELMEALVDGAKVSTLQPIGILRDEAISVACKRIVHHEISVYEKMLGYAKLLKQEQTASYLKQCLSEETESQFNFEQLQMKSIYSA